MHACIWIDIILILYNVIISHNYNIYIYIYVHGSIVLHIIYGAIPSIYIGYYMYPKSGNILANNKFHELHGVDVKSGI